MNLYDLSTQRPQLRENLIITALVKRIKDLERRVAQIERKEAERG